MKTSGNFYQSEKNIFSLCWKIPEMTYGSGQYREHKNVTTQFCHSFKTIHNDKIQKPGRSIFLLRCFGVQKESSEFFL